MQAVKAFLILRDTVRHSFEYGILCMYEQFKGVMKTGLVNQYRLIQGNLVDYTLFKLSRPLFGSGR